MRIAVDSWKRVDPFCVAIVLFGLGLRLWGIGWGLPYTYASDEPTVLALALRMIKTQDLNPHWWLWPSLLIYLVALVFVVYFSAGGILGKFPALSDLPMPEIITVGVGKLALPDELLIARAMIAFFSTLSIVLVYLLARRISANRSVGLLASALMAVSPVIVDYSQRVAPDQLALFFLLGTIWFAMRIADVPRLANYIGAGIFAGLAIAAKYNAIVGVLAIYLAHGLAFGIQGWRKKQWLIVSLLIPAVFILATPFSVLDFAGFWEGFQFNAAAYAASGRGEPGGNSLGWYLGYLWHENSLMTIAGFLGLGYLIWRQPKRGLTIGAFPVVYLIVIGQLYIHNDRTVMLIIPFLFVCGAYLIGEGLDSIAHRWRLPNVAMPLGVGLLFLLLLAPPLQRTWRANLQLTQVDKRESARRWLEANLTDGARVAVEAYAPYLDTSRFAVLGVGAVIDHSIDWYVKNGFEYIVISQAMSGRFFDNAAYYLDAVSKYNDFFSSLALVAHLDDIRIFKIPVTLPPHRIAARFGDNGDHIELVGYDVQPWKPGESLRLNLTWRTLTEKPEPYQAELRLIDENDNQVATIHSDVFQGKGWRPGLIETFWTIPLPSDFPAGNYRVQVNVDWTRFSYRLPAQNWRGENIEPVILAPMELK